MGACVLMQAETEASISALREEAVGLREALDAQRSQLERHYAGLHAKMRKEYEQVRTATWWHGVMTATRSHCSVCTIDAGSRACCCACSSEELLLSFCLVLQRTQTMMPAEA